MSQTFHPFRRLPPELRDMIWKFAIRSNRPGAHFFRAYNRLSEERLSDEYAVTLPTRSWDVYHLTVPKWLPRFTDVNLNGISRKGVITSGNCHNPSTYLVDGALWTTCKESRLVMERQFDIEKWKAVEGKRKVSRKTFTKWLRNDERMPSTGYFVDKDSTYLYFVVFPNRDLFCIRPYNFERYCYCGIQLNAVMDALPWGFNHLTNVALEFDPAWGTSAVRENQVEMLAYISQESDYELLIDYTIRRRHHVPTKEQAARPDSTVFYGSDCRFVEVPRDSSNDYSWEGVLDAQGERWSGCFKFLERLEAIVEFWRRHVPGIKRVKLGVLACEHF
ncbi:hypothetical protein F5Y06DRAFT_284707 [Hypoxylon sp. FL0890]|nr:hypothetical protein F5Y06DRAFT_284707 [Hypoxylon sp. FL0890]